MEIRALNSVGAGLSSVVFVSLAALLISGCASGINDELQSYVAEVKARPGGRIEPLPPIKPYENFTYAADNMRSPFAPDRPDAPSNIAGPRPIKDRNKEYLEQFPLDTLAMVGTVERDGRTFGLLQTQDGMVHRVTAGNYVGQNDGRITTVADAAISIEELVSDGIGSFYKRSAEIGLSD